MHVHSPICQGQLKEKKLDSPIVWVLGRVEKNAYKKVKKWKNYSFCFKQKNIYYIFWHFLTLPSIQTLTVIELFFFRWARLEKLGHEHAFQPYTYFLRPFSIRGAVGRFPLSKHRFRTCSLNRVKLYRFYLDSKIIKDCWLSSFNIVVCFSILELSEKPKSKIQ